LTYLKIATLNEKFSDTGKYSQHCKTFRRSLVSHLSLNAAPESLAEIESAARQKKTLSTFSSPSFKRAGLALPWKPKNICEKAEINAA